MSWAGTTGVRSSILGRNFSDFLLTPPPMMMSCGPQHALDQIEISLKAVGVLLPRQVVVLADRLGRPVFGLPVVERQVPELGVGH